MVLWGKRSAVFIRPGNESSRERMVPRTKVPSWERMFQGTNSLENEYSSILCSTATLCRATLSITSIHNQCFGYYSGPISYSFPDKWQYLQNSPSGKQIHGTWSPVDLSLDFLGCTRCVSSFIKDIFYIVVFCCMFLCVSCFRLVVSTCQVIV